MRFRRLVLPFLAIGDFQGGFEEAMVLANAFEHYRARMMCNSLFFPDSSGHVFAVYMFALIIDFEVGIGPFIKSALSTVHFGSPVRWYSRREGITP